MKRSEKAEVEIEMGGLVLFDRERARARFVDVDARDDELGSSEAAIGRLTILGICCGREVEVGVAMGNGWWWAYESGLVFKLALDIL